MKPDEIRNGKRGRLRMRFILIRHGRQSSPLCNVDVELSEEGRQQAGLLADRLKQLKPDRIYTSSLLRAKQTAGILFGEDSSFLEREELNEISFGDMTGRRDADNLVRYPEYFAAKKRKLSIVRKNFVFGKRRLDSKAENPPFQTVKKTIATVFYPYL